MSGPSRRTRDRSQRWLLLAALVVLPGLVLWRWIAGVRPEVDSHVASPASSVDSSRSDQVAAKHERLDELESTSNALADAHRDTVHDVEPAPAEPKPPPILGAIIGILRAQDSSLDAVSGRQLTCILLQSRGEPALGWTQNRRSAANRSVLTSARGEFSFTELDPGEWDLACDVAGYLPARLRCVVGADGGEQQVELALVPRHQIALYLTDDSGEPIVDRTSKAGYEALEQLAPWVCAKEPVDRSAPCAGVGMIPMKSRTTETGDPRVWRVVEIDTYEPMWIGIAIGDCVLDGRAVLGHEREVHFHVGERALKAILAKLRVEVNDANGVGIAGAEVRVGQGRSLTRRAITDANGRAELSGLPPVSNHVQFVHKNYLPTWSPVEFACGSEASVTVTLLAPIVVRGRLVNERGDPVRGSICAIRTPTQPGQGHDLVVVTADDSGRFEFLALAPDVHMLMDKRRLAQLGGSTRDVDANTPGAVRVDGRSGSVFGVTVIAWTD